MGGAFTQAGTFVIGVIFNLFTLAVLLRFILQWVKADFYNPLCQFLVRITNPFLMPIRRIIPGFRGIDFAAVVLMFLSVTIGNSLLLLINNAPFYPVAMLIGVVYELLILTIHLYFFAIIIRAILSWVNPDPYHPIVIILSQLTEPLLRPLRRIIPVISGFDLTPLVVLVLLQVVLIFIRAFFGAL